METHDEQDVVRRLRSFGSQPVESHVADQHASYLRAATPAARRGRMRPLMAGAMLAGAVLCGTGLAAALPGSLPEQAGSVARGALAAIDLVDDEADHDGERGRSAAAKAAEIDRDAVRGADDTDGPGSVERFLEGCTTGTPPVPFVGNHGQYVKAHPDDPATTDVNERQVAAESDCGKPVVSLVEEADDSEEEKAAKAAKAKDAADADGRADAAEGARPEDAGRPEIPGKSDEPHPPPTGVKEQGSGNRSTGTRSSGHAGRSAEHRPEGVGRNTTTTSATTPTTAA